MCPMLHRLGNSASRMAAWLLSCVALQVVWLQLGSTVVALGRVEMKGVGVQFRIAVQDRGSPADG